MLATGRDNGWASKYQKWVDSLWHCIKTESLWPRKVALIFKKGGIQRKLTIDLMRRGVTTSIHQRLSGLASVQPKSDSRVERGSSQKEIRWKVYLYIKWKLFLTLPTRVWINHPQLPCGVLEGILPSSYSANIGSSKLYVGVNEGGCFLVFVPQWLAHNLSKGMFTLARLGLARFGTIWFAGVNTGALHTFKRIILVPPPMRG